MAFDKAYVKQMVEDHHKVLQAFISEESSTANPSLKAAVKQGTGVIRSHLVHANQDATKLGIATAPVPDAM